MDPQPTPTGGSQESTNPSQPSQPQEPTKDSSSAPAPVQADKELVVTLPSQHSPSEVLVYSVWSGYSTRFVIGRLIYIQNSEHASRTKLIQEETLCFCDLMIKEHLLENNFDASRRLVEEDYQEGHRSHLVLYNEVQERYAIMSQCIVMLTQLKMIANEEIKFLMKTYKSSVLTQRIARGYFWRAYFCMHSILMKNYYNRQDEAFRGYMEGMRTLAEKAAEERRRYHSGRLLQDVCHGYLNRKAIFLPMVIDSITLQQVEEIRRQWNESYWMQGYVDIWTSSKLACIVRNESGLRVVRMASLATLGFQMYVNVLIQQERAERENSTGLALMANQGMYEEYRRICILKEEGYGALMLELNYDFAMTYLDIVREWYIKFCDILWYINDTRILLWKSERLLRRHTIVAVQIMEEEELWWQSTAPERDFWVKRKRDMRPSSSEEYTEKPHKMGARTERKGPKSMENTVAGLPRVKTQTARNRNTLSSGKMVLGGSKTPHGHEAFNQTAPTRPPISSLPPTRHALPPITNK